MTQRTGAVRHPSIRTSGLAMAAAALWLASVALTGAAAADAWPSRPLRIIVPFAPGGGADSSARVLAEAMAPALGQSIVVDNKPGAGSAIGVTAAAQSKDGHTLLMGSNSMVINPSLLPSISYDVARDFEPVGMVSAQPLVLVVPADSKLQSVKDLIAQAKAAPGTLSAGNSGNGTLAHIASEIFASQTGTSLTTVPYKGESALMPDLISGRIAIGFLNLPSVISQLKSGRLRALAVSSPQPVPDLPGVPTFRSLGFESLEVQGWAVLVVPKGTIPADGLARLASALNKALASDEVRKRFANLSLTVLTMSREATGQFLAAETARYAAVIKVRGIKID